MPEKFTWLMNRASQKNFSMLSMNSWEYIRSLLFNLKSSLLYDRFKFLSDQAPMERQTESEASSFGKSLDQDKSKNIKF